MENFDVSSLQEEALRNIEADSFWCMSKLLDGIQVYTCTTVCVRARLCVCVHPQKKTCFETNSKLKGHDRFWTPQPTKRFTPHLDANSSSVCSFLFFLQNVIVLHILKLDRAAGDCVIANWPQQQISFRSNVSLQNLLPTSTLNQLSQRSFPDKVFPPGWVVNLPSCRLTTHT